eukprot:TRINITY_DN11570_c0_g1_i4.p1 TRINITY_DN11570_c0_g1~~TRINITY_DN11570_c0_g1_i4.p1  ORF type:complete len:1988 (+),score=573.17 TRINITY_DN11570_c0_g1_i4:87-6050(+)
MCIRDSIMMVLCLVLYVLVLPDTEGLPLAAKDGSVDRMERFNVLVQQELGRGRLNLEAGPECEDRYEVPACLRATESGGCSLPAVRQRCAATCGLCRGSLGGSVEPDFVAVPSAKLRNELETVKQVTHQRTAKEPMVDTRGVESERTVSTDKVSQADAGGKQPTEISLLHKAERKRQARENRDAENRDAEEGRVAVQVETKRTKVDSIQKEIQSAREASLDASKRAQQAEEQIDKTRTKEGRAWAAVSSENVQDEQQEHREENVVSQAVEAQSKLQQHLQQAQQLLIVSQGRARVAEAGAAQAKQTLSNLQKEARNTRDALDERQGDLHKLKRTQLKSVDELNELELQKIHEEGSLGVDTTKTVGQIAVSLQELQAEARDAKVKFGVAANMRAEIEAQLKEAREEHRVYQQQLLEKETVLRIRLDQALQTQQHSAMSVAKAEIARVAESQQDAQQKTERAHEQHSTPENQVVAAEAETIEESKSNHEKIAGAVEDDLIKLQLNVDAENETRTAQHLQHALALEVVLQKPKMLQRQLHTKKARSLINEKQQEVVVRAKADQTTSKTHDRLGNDLTKLAHQVEHTMDTVSKHQHELYQSIQRNNLTVTIAEHQHLFDQWKGQHFAEERKVEQIHQARQAAAQQTAVADEAGRELQIPTQQVEQIQAQSNSERPRALKMASLCAELSKLQARIIAAEHHLSTAGDTLHAEKDQQPQLEYNAQAVMEKLQQEQTIAQQLIRIEDSAAQSAQGRDESVKEAISARAALAQDHAKIASELASANAGFEHTQDSVRAAQTGTNAIRRIETEYTQASSKLEESRYAGKALDIKISNLNHEIASLKNAQIGALKTLSTEERAVGAAVHRSELKQLEDSEIKSKVRERKDAEAAAVAQLLNVRARSMQQSSELQAAAQVAAASLNAVQLQAYAATHKYHELLIQASKDSKLQGAPDVQKHLLVSEPVRAPHGRMHDPSNQQLEAEKQVLASQSEVHALLQSTSATPTSKEAQQISQDQADWNRAEMMLHARKVEIRQLQPLEHPGPTGTAQITTEWRAAKIAGSFAQSSQQLTFNIGEVKQAEQKLSSASATNRAIDDPNKAGNVSQTDTKAKQAAPSGNQQNNEILKDTAVERAKFAIMGQDVEVEKTAEEGGPAIEHERDISQADSRLQQEMHAVVVAATRAENRKQSKHVLDKAADAPVQRREARADETELQQAEALTANAEQVKSVAQEALKKAGSSLAAPSTSRNKRALSLEATSERLLAEAKTRMLELQALVQRLLAERQDADARDLSSGNLQPEDQVAAASQRGRVLKVQQDSKAADETRQEALLQAQLHTVAAQQAETAESKLAWYINRQSESKATNGEDHLRELRAYVIMTRVKEEQKSKTNRAEQILQTLENKEETADQRVAAAKELAIDQAAVEHNLGKEQADDAALRHQDHEGLRTREVTAAGVHHGDSLVVKENTELQKERLKAEEAKESAMQEEADSAKAVKRAAPLKVAADTIALQRTDHADHRANVAAALRAREPHIDSVDSSAEALQEAEAKAKVDADRVFQLKTQQQAVRSTLEATQQREQQQEQLGLNLLAKAKKEEIKAEEHASKKKEALFKAKVNSDTLEKVLKEEAQSKLILGEKGVAQAEVRTKEIQTKVNEVQAEVKSRQAALEVATVKELDAKKLAQQTEGKYAAAKIEVDTHQNTIDALEAAAKKAAAFRNDARHRLEEMYLGDHRREEQLAEQVLKADEMGASDLQAVSQHADILSDKADKKKAEFDALTETAALASEAFNRAQTRAKQIQVEKDIEKWQKPAAPLAAHKVAVHSVGLEATVEERLVDVEEPSTLKEEEEAQGRKWKTMEERAVDSSSVSVLEAARQASMSVMHEMAKAKQDWIFRMESHLTTKSHHRWFTRHVQKPAPVVSSLNTLGYGSGDNVVHWQCFSDPDQQATIQISGGGCRGAVIVHTQGAEDLAGVCRKQFVSALGTHFAGALAQYLSLIHI